LAITCAAYRNRRGDIQCVIRFGYAKTPNNACRRTWWYAPR
jgi:hypothetical protein